MNDLERMKELIQILNEAGKAYYQQDKEVMSNLEYDKMYDELLELEKTFVSLFFNLKVCIRNTIDPMRIHATKHIETR